MANNLFILATPIGNLNEANNLLIQKLNELEIIFCEDTRVTKNLLSLLKIKNKPKLISYHKFNETQKLDELISFIKQKDCGLISDAGYPCISDPGHLIINKCHEHKINVNVVNGSCAINHAIVQSGFCEDGYVFIGFIPRKDNDIVKKLNDSLSLGLPVVFFESVHRVNNTIKLIKKNFANNLIYIGRELTKKFEQYTIGKLQDIEQQEEKGEFCLIIKPNETSNIKDNDFNNELFEEIRMMIKHNIKLKDACKYLASKNNLDASKLYNEAIKQNIKNN